VHWDCLFDNKNICGSMEIIINNGYQSFWKRFKRSYLNYFLLVSLGAFLSILVSGQDKTIWLIYFSFSIGGFIYCIITTKTVLYRAVFVGESNSIKIEILKFDKIKVTYLVKAEDFNVSIKKNFLSRYPPWVLVLYERNKILYSQEEVFGWSYTDFLKFKQLIALK